jgi:UDP-glucuronate decarboxylase
MRLMATPDDFGGPINLGNPNECTILELARTIVDLTGSRSTIEHAPLPSDDPCRRCPDTRLAKAALDWQPRVALREGLLRTIAYFDAQLTKRSAPRSAPAGEPAPAA